MPLSFQAFHVGFVYPQCGFIQIPFIFRLRGGDIELLELVEIPLEKVVYEQNRFLGDVFGFAKRYRFSFLQSPFDTLLAPLQVHVVWFKVHGEGFAEPAWTRALRNCSFV